MTADANAPRPSPYAGLRSPTRDLHPPYSSPDAAGRTSLLQSPPPPLHSHKHGHSRSPYVAARADAEAPAAHALASSSNGNPSHHHHHHHHHHPQPHGAPYAPQAPSASPRPGSYYADPSPRPREKPASGSYYDPTTDTKERPVSDSWRASASTPKVSPPAPSPLLFFPSTWAFPLLHAPTSAPPLFPSCPIVAVRHPCSTRTFFFFLGRCSILPKPPVPRHGCILPCSPPSSDLTLSNSSHSQPADQHQPYYNGSYTSPGVSYGRPRSPLSHSHPSLPASSLSPPSHRPRASSPKRLVTPSVAAGNGPSVLPPVMKPEPPPSSLSPKPVAVSAVSRCPRPYSIGPWANEDAADSQPCCGPHVFHQHPVQLRAGP